MQYKKIIAVLFVIIWMTIIFSFSNQKGEGSSSTSKRVSKIIVNVIDIQQKYTQEQKNELIEKIEPYLRKVAHFSIYAIGGFLVMNAIQYYVGQEKRMIAISASIGILYAITDELHQLLVVGRSGRIGDVLIDSLGVCMGISVFLLMKEVFKRRHCKDTEVKGGEVN